jgi:hypothetical protein
MKDRDVAGGGSDEEKAWRDLVARFDGQPEDQPSTAPWPERENLRTSLDGKPPPAQPESDDPPARPVPSDPSDSADLAEDEDHFVPPAPPPLPRLEPVLKGAWLALFGGPAYLLVATAAGWTVPGWAAFCAMAAFVSGFVVLVLHLGDDHRDNGSGSDDGAVV